MNIHIGNADSSLGWTYIVHTDDGAVHGAHGFTSHKEAAIAAIQEQVDNGYDTTDSVFFFFKEENGSYSVDEVKIKLAV